MRLKYLLLVILFLIFPSLATAASWQYEKEIDPLTDIETAYAYNRNQNGTIFVRCSNLELEVYIDFHKFLDNDPIFVTYRIDKLEPISNVWSNSTDGTAVFAPDALNIAQSIRQGNQFIIEALDWRGSPNRITFYLQGSSAAITPVLELCKAPLISIPETPTPSPIPQRIFPETITPSSSPQLPSTSIPTPTPILDLKTFKFLK